MNNKKLTLQEISDMCGLTLEQAISDVCDCDLMYGQVCEYHKNPDMKASLKKWQDMSTRGDQYGIYQNTRFYPTKSLEKQAEEQTM